MSRNQLLPVLEKCGLVDALLMPPNKPYSCVRYKTVEESKKAYDMLNGKEIVDDLGQKIILYLNFVEKGMSYRYLFKNGFWFCVSFLSYLSQKFQLLTFGHPIWGLSNLSPLFFFITFFKCLLLYKYGTSSWREII